MISSQGGRRAIYGGLIVDIAEDSLDRVNKLLAAFPGGARKAVGSALTRAAQAGKTAVKKPVTEEYYLTSGEFLRQTRNINHFRRDGADTEIVFGFRGCVIPLTRFHTTVRGGRVVTQVKRSGTPTALDEAFRASMGGHTGIYERMGPERFPVRELYGPATPQMIYSNETVLDKTEETMAEVYERRIEHEINVILNGWR